MRIILISDLHLTSAQPIGRKDVVLNTGLAKLKFVLDYATSNNVKWILQAGDFCDKSRDWTLLLELCRLLEKYQSIHIFTIQGQHDYYYRYKSGNATTIGILEQAGLINILHNPLRNLTKGGWAVTPMHWGDKMPKPIRGYKNILVAHTPIHPAKVHPKHEATTNRQIKTLLKKWNIVLLGDIHRSFRKSISSHHIVNTGPMLRLESTGYNMIHEPHFYVFRTERPNYLERVNIPHKPAEEVLHHSSSQDKPEPTSNSIKQLSQAMAKKFKDNTNKVRIRDILKETKNIKRSVKKIIINAYDEATK